MLGRHNITIYADEAERFAGAVRQMLAQENMEFAEECYWLGAMFLMEKILSTAMPDNHKALVAALKLHFTGEAPGNEQEKEGNDA